MARILITGGAGFIGSNMAQAFLKKGYDITILDNFCSGKLENIKEFLSSITLVEGDICDPKSIQKAMKGCDFVFHLAALRSVPKSFEDPAAYERTNVLGTIYLLEESTQNKVKKFVFASSSSVYGNNTKLPLQEEDKTDPISPYAISKLNAEKYCRLYYVTHKLPTVCLRYFNVFGPRQSLENRYAVVIPKFIQSLYNNEAPPIFGDGKQTRDFTFVENVVEAHHKVLISKLADGEIFNVGCGQRSSVFDLAKKINQIMNKNMDPKLLPPRPGDVLHTQASIKKIEKLSSYQPKITLDKGLAITTEWFLKNHEYLKAKGD